MLAHKQSLLPRPETLLHQAQIEYVHLDVRQALSRDTECSVESGGATCAYTVIVKDFNCFIPYSFQVSKVEETV